MTEPDPAHVAEAKPSWEWEQRSSRMNPRQSRNPIWELQNKRLSIKKSQIRPLHLERSSNSVLACHFFFGIEGSASWEGLSAAPDAPAKLIFISANLCRIEKASYSFSSAEKVKLVKSWRYFFSNFLNWNSLNFQKKITRKMDNFHISIFFQK